MGFCMWCHMIYMGMSLAPAPDISKIVKERSSHHVCFVLCVFLIQCHCDRNLSDLRYLIRVPKTFILPPLTIYKLNPYEYSATPFLISYGFAYSSHLHVLEY